MAGDKKDVELRIRAILEGKHTFKDTLDALDKIEKAQESLIDSAKKGKDGPATLAKAFAEMGKVADELLRKNSLIEQFQAQSATLAKLKTSLDAVRDAQTTYAASLDKEPTKKEQAQLAAYERKVNSTAKALQSFQNRFEAFSAKLREQGIDTQQIVSTQNQLATALQRTEAVLVRQSAALKTVEADAAAYKAQADAVRKLEQAESDRLATLQQIAQAEQRRKGSDALQAELASIREAEELSQRLASDRFNARSQEMNAELANMRQLQGAERARTTLIQQIRDLERTAARERSVEQSDEIARLQALLRVEDARVAALVAKERAFNEAANRRRADETAAARSGAEERERARANAALSAATTNAARVRALADADGQKRAQEREAAEQAELKRLQDIKAFQDALLQQKEREIAKARELRSLADASAVDARGASTFARPQRAAPGPSLAGTIQGILNPGAEAVRTLDGVEAAVSRVEKAAANATGPLRDVKVAMEGMTAAQRSISVIAGQVDAFQRQIVAVRTARQEYVEARAKVADLAAQMRSGLGGDELVGQMSRAQAALKGAAEEMGKQVLRARDMRGALRSAGVSTSDLAGTQELLQQQAKRSVTATDQMTKAVKEFGVVGEDTDRKSRSWSFLIGGKGERTTLSYMQRLRGEALALGTTFVGLNAAIGLARGAINVMLADNKIMNRLLVVTGGDTAKAAEEFQYLRGAVRAIGVDFQTAADGYSKFAIAAQSSTFTVAGKQVKLTGLEIRRIFEQLSIAARNAGLSNEEYEGTLKAVEQMMSKGVIQAEELKGQLGDRLPGAVGILAESMGKTTAELLKMMEQGGVTAMYVLNFADKLGSKFGNRTKDAAADLQAAINSQNMAMRDFQKALATSGFIEAYTEFLKKLTTLLNSEQGSKLATQLSTVFSAIVDVLGWVADNIELVKAALIGLGSLKIAGWLMGVSKEFGGIAGAMKTAQAEGKGLFSILEKAGGSAGVFTKMTTAVSLLRTAFLLLGRAVPVVGAIIAAYEVGSAVFERMEKRQAGKPAPTPTGNAMGDVFGDMDPSAPQPTPERRPAAPGAMQALFGGGDGLTPSQGRNVSSDDAELDAIKAALAKTLKGAETKNRAARMAGAKSELEERIAIATEELEAMKTAARERIKGESQLGEALAEIDKRIALVRDTETRKFNKEQAKHGQALNDKRLKLAQELSQSLEAITAKTDEKEAKIDPGATFEQRLAARRERIDAEFNAITDKLNRLDELSKNDPQAKKALSDVLEQRGITGGVEGARKAVTAAKDAAQDTNQKEATQKEIERLEKRLAEAQSALENRVGVIQARADNGQIGRDDAAKGIGEATAELAPNIQDASQKLREFATQYKKVLTPDQFDGIIFKLDILNAKLNPDRTKFDETLKATEANLQDILDRRAQALAQIDTLQKNNLISGTDAANRTNEAYKASMPALDDYVQRLIDIAQARVASGFASDDEKTKLTALIAKYKNLQIELKNTSEQFGTLGQAGIDATSGAIQNGIGQVGDQLGAVLSKQHSMADAFDNIGKVAATTFAQILRDIGIMMLKLEIANALAGSDNKFLSGVGVKLGGTKTAAPGTPGVAVGGGAAPTPALPAGAVGGAGEAAGGAAEAAGAAAGGASDALTTAAQEAAAIQTAAATTAATTTTVGATTAAGITEGGAAAAEVIDKGSSVLSATTEQTSATTAAGIEQAGATTFAATVSAAADVFAAKSAASTLHSGGVIGGSSASHNTPVRASWFAGAPRFHNGGIPGLKRDEVPAVLQKGEEVVTRNDPRHVLNGGRMPVVAGGGGSQRFVLVDDRSKVPEAMASAQGEQVTMLHLKRNLPTLKSWLKV